MIEKQYISERDEYGMVTLTIIKTETNVRKMGKIVPKSEALQHKNEKWARKWLYIEGDEDFYKDLRKET